MWCILEKERKREGRRNVGEMKGEREDGYIGVGDVRKYEEWLEESVEVKRVGQTGSQQPAHNAFYFIIVLLAAVSLILYLC